MPGRFPPISQELLLALAGKAALARGVAYHKEGRVALMAAGPERALASVRGTETYRVELRPRRDGLAGSCECPAFDDSGFCKHMVAVALAASEAGSADRMAPLREHLVALGAEALADRLLRLAELDAGLLRDIEREIADAVEDDAALVARYRQAIDEATDPRGGVDYWGAGAYAEEIASVLEPLNALARSGRPQPALELVEHLLECIEEGLDEADDSEGEVFEVGLRACRLHLELCRMVRPDPIQLAGELFEREIGASVDLFSDSAETYAEVLGPQGVAEYHRLAAEAWSGLAPPKRNEFDPRRATLKSILDRAAEQAGDVDARIALRKPELTSAAAYREIADLCVAAGREAEALRWIDEGLWCFEDHPDERLQRRAAELMARSGRTSEAQALLWRIFERQPSLAVYRELAAIPGADSPAVEATALLRRLAQEDEKPGPWMNHPAMTLFDLQMEFGDVDQAWETVLTWGVGELRLRALADRSIESHPVHATRTYEFLAQSRIATGGAQNYDEAVALVRRRGIACGDAADQAAYVEGLRVQHKAKRTFIQRLKALP